MKIAAIVLAVAMSLLAQAPAKKIVFVCEHGAAKSVIAATEFQRMAKEKGLNLEILFRGTVPDPQIAPGVRAGLHADGLEAGTANPTKVTKVLDWSSTPAPSKDYRAARDYIRQQLHTLLEEISPK